MIRCIRKAQDNLRAGITSVRSLGERFDHDVVLRDAVEAGVVEGPRIFASGDVAWTATTVGADQVRREVRRMARLGVDQIKLLGSGGIPTRSKAGITTPFIGRDELVAACDEAQRWDLPVVLHAMGDETIRIGIDLGVRSIEHAFAMTEAMVPKLAASDTALCPNLVVTECWDPEWMAPAGFPDWMVRNAAEARARHHAVVRACIEAGVRMLAGADDLPEPHGPIGIERAGGRPGLLREIELMVELGATPGQALQAATANAAWAVGRAGVLGTVTPGKLADLLVLDDDPLEHPGTLGSVRRVYARGRLVA
jgi:imidazolonepropionase-like amidohydrolase